MNIILKIRYNKLSNVIMYNSKITIKQLGPHSKKIFYLFNIARGLKKVNLGLNNTYSKLLEIGSRGLWKP